MSLQIPSKELVQVDLIKKSQLKIEQEIQFMIDHIDKEQALIELTNLINKLTNFKNHYASTKAMSSSHTDTASSTRSDRRTQRN